MRFLPVLLLVFATFYCGLPSGAQSKHVYEDSSILYTEEEVAAPVPVPGEEQQITTSTEAVTDEEIQEEAVFYRDTFIVSNRHFLSADSIRLLKEDKQFLYAKNLDSLLQDLKKKAEEEERKRKKKSDRSNSTSSSKDVYPSGPSFAERLFKSNGLQYVLWSLAGLFVLFVIYKLVFAEGGFRKTVSSANNVKVLEEEEVTPTPGRNFDTAVAKAVSENNYRLAVRYLYLQLLQRLAAAGAIEFAVDKTNTEYLRELTGKPYKEAVSELTRYYDYVWYGEFEMDAALYAKVESKFKNLVI